MSQSWMKSDDERRTFRRLNAVLHLFRGQDGEMPIQQILTFCWVALNEGGVQRDLCNALDMPHSTASRNLAALSPIHRLGKPGLGLITWVENPEDRRAKLLMLTEKGRAFATQITDLL